MTEWLENWLEKLAWGLLVLAVLGIPLAMVAGRKEKQEWEAFKFAHDCKITSRIDGAVMPTVAIDTSGKAIYGMTTTPSKTGWTCDDGVTYYK